MRLLFLPLVLFGAWMFPVFSPAARAQTATASYQALNWDKEITLPTDAYRAAKGIDLNGDFTVKTQPGTLIEGVGFHARSGVQHWHVEGTLFRRVNVTVKRNGSGHGIDSAFEDFDFNKDDNWYNFWWSTRWRFDNCVFTKKFLRGELTPLDYSVHATRCTFYGMKLPGVGFKENPANYMGKGDMVFEKCRFVDCEVPQTFLASTVDCVFEGCRFEAKGRLQWPKETTAIKVHAYYATGGSEPASFINGPLSVEFEAAPGGGEFGSTVPHTQSGGRITLTNQHLNGQYVQLGTVQKKASEIVDVAVGAPDAAVTPTAPAVRPVVAPVVATGEVHSVEEMLRSLPPNLEVMAHGQPNPAGVETANAVLARNFAGHAVTLRLTLAGTQATTEGGNAYQANARPQETLYHGGTIPVYTGALFRPANAGPLAQLQVNTEFSVRGVVRRAAVVGRGATVVFSLVIGEAQVMDKLAALAPAGTVSPAAAASPEAQMVGVWTVLVRDSGASLNQTYAADHSFTDEGGRTGTWEITGTQFLVHLAGVGTDAYNLPVRDGVMYGKNLESWPLTLVRQGTPTPVAYQNEMIGTWEFFNHDGEGWHRTYQFAADHTFKEGDSLIGHWETLGHSLVFHWEGHGDWHDIFELPGTNGVLTGVNGFHHALTLTKQEGKPGTTYFGNHTD